MEPIEPVVFLEVHEMGTDDDEGPVHDTISHNRLEIRDLSKYDTRGFKYPTIYMLQIHPVYEQLGKNARKGNNKIFDRTESPTSDFQIKTHIYALTMLG